MVPTKALSFFSSLIKKKPNQQTTNSQPSFDNLPYPILSLIIQKADNPATNRVNKSWNVISKQLNEELHYRIKAEFPKQYARLKKKRRKTLTSNDYYQARNDCYFYLTNYEKEVFDAFKAGDLEQIEKLRSSDPIAFYTALYRFDTEGMNPLMWCFHNYQLLAADKKMIQISINIR